VKSEKAKVSGIATICMKAVTQTQDVRDKLAGRIILVFWFQNHLQTGVFEYSLYLIDFALKLNGK
jgi:hypothetical protein